MKNVLSITVVSLVTLMLNGCVGHGVANVANEAFDSSDFPLVKCESNPYKTTVTKTKKSVLNGETKYQVEEERTDKKVLALNSFLYLNGDSVLHIQWYDGFDENWNIEGYDNYNQEKSQTGFYNIRFKKLESSEGVMKLLDTGMTSFSKEKIYTFDGINNTLQINDLKYECVGRMDTIVAGAGIRY